MALKDIPNYRKGTPKEHCSNCGAFKGREVADAYTPGRCTMYETTVAPGDVCDSWYSRKVLRVTKGGG